MIQNRLAARHFSLEPQNHPVIATCLVNKSAYVCCRLKCFNFCHDVSIVFVTDSITYDMRHSYQQIVLTTLSLLKKILTAPPLNSAQRISTRDSKSLEFTNVYNPGLAASGFLRNNALE